MGTVAKRLPKAKKSAVSAGRSRSQTTVPRVHRRSSRLNGASTRIVFVVLLVGLVAGYALSLGVTHAVHARATSTAKSFIAALNTGNNTKAYALGSTTLHKAQTESQFTSGVGNLLAPKPAYISQATSFNGSTATFTAIQNGLPLSASGSTTGTFTVTLSKTGLTGWAVDAVSVR